MTVRGQPRHFAEELRKKLQDPVFRKIEGFPIGSDEAILNMSDPPYYTACPNPWLSEFCKEYGRAYDPQENYVRQPLAIDVSVGKYDGLYKAHSYHTKVPHLAIVPSILHYTQPGDIILDGFCGSGMTGVAAQWCGMAPQEYRLAIEAECKTSGRLPPAWGHRKAILSDLSPAATYIASNYNSFVDINRFEAAAQNLLDTLKNELGWMYKTTVPGVGEVLMEYTVWSEVLFCHSCSGEILFEKVAVDTETYKIRDEITCPHCGATGKKEDMELCFETVYDPIAGVEKRLPKRIPTKIFYKHNATLHFKEPDDSDLEVLSKIGVMSFPKEFPSTEFPDSQMKRVGRMATTKISTM